jgi:glycosyltransferase involved in cell wall biosynthesis
MADTMGASHFDALVARARAVQRSVLPDGPTVVSSTAPYDTGGLGRVLVEIVETLRGAGTLAARLGPGHRRDDEDGCAVTVDTSRAAALALALPPVRFSHPWRLHLGNLAFDAAGAGRLPSTAEHLLVFNGHALRHAAAARRVGYASVGLISANSHLTNAATRHRQAYRQYPVERPWGPVLERRNLAEYDVVDRVYVASQYAWESFVSHGFPEHRLRLFPYTPDDRFRPAPSAPVTSTFDVVYVGSLAVHKGVPLLLDAFSRLPHDDMRLVLVGGWGTRSMRRHVQAHCARDRRIRVRPGDPLPALHRAGLCVHPSYEDGFGYAPAEALACGVPVIVSQDTGMKDLLRSDAQGRVVPTGDRDALVEAIDAAYRGAPAAARSAGRAT